MGRRIIKTVAGTGSWDGTLNYYLDGDSVLEEQNGSNMTLKQFIWGSDYIDDLVQVSLNSSPSTQSTCDTPYWTMGDANWNMLGLVNASGILIERYEYTPYGERSVFMRSGSGFSGVSGGSNDPGCYLPLAGSQRFVTSGSVTQFYGLCEVGFQGLMHDEESGIIFNRRRDNDTLLERFMEQDPKGYRDGLDLLQYEWSDPVRYLDPKGTVGGHVPPGGGWSPRNPFPPFRPPRLPPGFRFNPPGCTCNIMMDGDFIMYEVGSEDLLITTPSFCPLQVASAAHNACNAACDYITQEEGIPPNLLQFYQFVLETELAKTCAPPGVCHNN